MSESKDILLREKIPSILLKETLMQMGTRSKKSLERGQDWAVTELGGSTVGKGKNYKRIRGVDRK